MTKFGGRNDGDLTNLERATETADNTLAHSIFRPGMRYGGRDETNQHQVVTRIDHLEDRVVEHIRENLIPRVQEHSRISIDTDPVKFLYYQKLQFGRLCSCFDRVNGAADKQCPICYGRAYVGGYHKYGTNHHVVDMTAPNLTLVNVAPDFGSGQRPVPLTLLDTAVKGYIELTVPLGANRGVLDAMRMKGKAQNGSSITPLVKLKGQADSEFVIVTKSVVETKLRDAFGRPNSLVFRFVMDRINPDAELPEFLFFYLRYTTLDDIKVTLDIPKREKSIEFQEYGLLDVVDTIEAVASRKLPNITSEDMFIRVLDGERFKVIQTSQWEPENQLVETAIRARHINKEEHLYRVL